MSERKPRFLFVCIAKRRTFINKKGGKPNSQCWILLTKDIKTQQAGKKLNERWHFCISTDENVNRGKVCFLQCFGVFLTRNKKRASVVAWLRLIHFNSEEINLLSHSAMNIFFLWNITPIFHMPRRRSGGSNYRRYLEPNEAPKPRERKAHRL